MTESESETGDTEYSSENDQDFCASRRRTRVLSDDEDSVETSTGKWRKAQMAKAERETALRWEHTPTTDIAKKVFEQIDLVEHVTKHSNLKGESVRRMKRAVIILRAAMRVMSKRTQPEADVLLLKSQSQKLEGKVEEQAALVQQLRLDMDRMKNHLRKESRLGTKMGESSKKSEESHGEVHAEPPTPEPAKRVTIAESPAEDSSPEPTWEEPVPKPRTKLPRRPPRSAAILLYIEKANGSEEYRDAMKLAQERLQLSDFGIDGLRMRTARNGAWVMEVRGHNKQEKADKLASALKEVLTETGATISRPLKWGELKLPNLDESVTEAEITEEIAKVGKCAPDEVHTSPIIRTRLGTAIAWVKCPLEVAIAIARKETVSLGGSPCQVELLKAQPQRCYRCFKEGHISSQCKETNEDVSRVCHRCGEEGHISRDCRNEMSCKLCREAGKDHRHRIGSEKCWTRAPQSSKRLVQDF